MHARMGIVQTARETFEQGLKMMETQALPSLRLMDGFRGESPAHRPGSG